MNELDSFTINFITNGLDKLQDGIKDLRGQMDALDESFQKGSTKGDSFFGKFGGWIAGLGAMAAGFLSIREAINGVFGVADKIIDLNLTADRVGRSALEVETLSRALLRFSNKTDVKDMFGEAEGLYKALNRITGKAWRLQFGSDLTEELNRAGGIMFNGDESDQEMISKIIQGLEYHTNNKDWYGREQFAKVLGITDTAAAFLGSGEAAVDKILKTEREKSHLYTEDNLKSAHELMEARRQLKDTWDKIYEQLQPAVTKMIKAFNLLVEKLEPIIKVVISALGWIAEKFGWLLDWANKSGEKVGNWFFDNILNPYHESKKKTNAKEAYERLDEFLHPNDVFLDGAEYDSVSDLLNDIASVKDQIGKSIEDTPETKALLELASQKAREMSNAKLISAGRAPITTNGTVNIDTINITGMEEDAAIKTKNALGKHLENVIQPAYNGIGDL